MKLNPEKWTAMVGKRALVNTLSSSLHEVVVTEISPSQKYVKLTHVDKTTEWLPRSDVGVIELLP